MGRYVAFSLKYEGLVHCCPQCAPLSETSFIIVNSQTSGSIVEYLPWSGKSSSSILCSRWYFHRNLCPFNETHSTLGYVASTIRRNVDNKISFMRRSLQWKRFNRHFNHVASPVRPSQFAIILESASRDSPGRLGSSWDVTECAAERNRFPFFKTT